jgi:polysaccharide biosynthesis/export protein
MKNVCRIVAIWSLILVAFTVLAACSSQPTLPPAKAVGYDPSPDYFIGPLDTLNIFVWRNPELSETLPVRPDGRISIPLIEDLPAAGKTPTQLARDIEAHLKRYVQDPIVTVIVTAFNGPYARQVRVVGEAAHPQAIPYRENMTLLDVMIAVGGHRRAYGERPGDVVPGAHRRLGQGRRRIGQRADAARRRPYHPAVVVLGISAASPSGSARPLRQGIHRGAAYRRG